MQSNLIAKFSDGRLVAIYNNEDGLVARVCESGRWLPERALLKGAQLCFNASLALPGELQIYAQDKKGSVVLISYNGENIQSKIILENRSDNIHAILFTPVGSSGYMSLLYNIPAEEGKQKLIIQKPCENGKWAEPEEIAVLSENAERIFEFCRINENHGIVFYRQLGQGLGYREITAEQAGEFVPVFRQGENAQGYSFFASDDSLHVVYLSSTLFSARLVYRRKISSGFEQPVILWEGQWLDNCLICEINGKICVFFQSGGTLYLSESSDNGASFSKAEIYKHKFCRLPRKAIYISECPQDNYKAHHVFVDSAHPWDIQILPDMYNDFYTYYEKPSEIIAEPSSVQKNDINPNELMAEAIERLTAENQGHKIKIAELMEVLSKREEEISSLKNKEPETEEYILKYPEEENNLLMRLEDTDLESKEISPEDGHTKAQ